jgi:hypothetical protein
VQQNKQQQAGISCGKITAFGVIGKCIAKVARDAASEFVNHSRICYDFSNQFLALAITKQKPV